MKIVVMGPQGSGKSTQAELLAQKLQIPHLQIGELYRQIAKQDSLVGRKVKEYLDKGQLVSLEEHNKIFVEELGKSKYRSGFVLDGVPRTLEQAQSLPFEPNRVFYLIVSDKENIKRLSKRARPDDTSELITKRLRIYHQETEPVLDFYRRKGILEEVDGERSIEVIFEDIWERMKKWLP